MNFTMLSDLVYQSALAGTNTCHRVHSEDQTAPLILRTISYALWRWSRTGDSCDSTRDGSSPLGLNIIAACRAQWPEVKTARCEVYLLSHNVSAFPLARSPAQMRQVLRSEHSQGSGVMLGRRFRFTGCAKKNMDSSARINSVAGNWRQACEE
jgi:hypothetical protein